MAIYRLSNKAEEDLLDIWSYIAEKQPVKRYLILYHQIPGGIEVVRVVHGSRDLGALFDTGDAE